MVYEQNSVPNPDTTYMLKKLFLKKLKAQVYKLLVILATDYSLNVDANCSLNWDLDCS